MATLALKGLRKSYGTVETIAGVDLQVESGELVVFVGPSGCGKSTLLRMIAGLEDISGGELEIDGQNVTHVAPAQRGVAMVFQSYALYPHMTVYDNMAFGLSLAGTSKDELHQRVTRAADILQLGALLQRKPKELSGGQRQRVAIGRAIVRKPKVFLFDEPLSNLDAALRVQMRIELARLHADLKATMVYVTHDQVEAMTLADRIVVINKGRIEQVGTPLELYHRPANLFVAGFMGSPKMNLMAASAVAGEAAIELSHGARVPLAAPVNGLTPGAALTMGIRPEHITLAPSPEGAVRAQVSVIERLGNETFAHLDVRTQSQELFVVRLDAEANIQPGDWLHLSFPTHRINLFDASGRNLLLNPAL